MAKGQAYVPKQLAETVSGMIPLWGLANPCCAFLVSGHHPVRQSGIVGSRAVLPAGMSAWPSMGIVSYWPAAHKLPFS